MHCQTAPCATVASLKRTPDVPRGGLTIANQHHEYQDCREYPDGLKGREINDLSRMGIIVDVFSVLAVCLLRRY